MKLRIAILGTRGIPNNYGGFECLAENLSEGLVKSGHDVYVYNVHHHPYKEAEWRGVNIIHCKDPVKLMGSASQFVYDLNCIIDSRKRNLDVIIFLGYTSSPMSRIFYPPSAVITYNMDGMEWKRSKYSFLTKKYLMYAEKMAVKQADFVVADSLYIKNYLEHKYKKEVSYIAYGSHAEPEPDHSVLERYGLSPFCYHMLMARMEPENSIETILDGYHQARAAESLVVVGNTTNKFGSYLTNKFKKDQRIRFIGPVYQKEDVCHLMHYSQLYFHGHSVGGTNPSLLQAMGNNCLIVAQDNIFNRSVLDKNAYFFRTCSDVLRYVESGLKKKDHLLFLENNSRLIGAEYSWEKIVAHYEKFICNSYLAKKNSLSYYSPVYQRDKGIG
jgi:hypothetical protein